MATDDKVVKQVVAEAKEAAAAPTPEMVPKDKLDDALARMKQYEDTLALLQKQDRTPTNLQNQQFVAQAAQNLGERIAKRIGTSDTETINQYLPLLNAYSEEAIAPVMNILASLADKFNELDARTSIADYADYKDDIAKTRQEKLSSDGRYLNHTEAYDLVRSKRIPQMLEAERKKALEVQKNAQAEADSALDVTGDGVAKAGPSPAKLPAKMDKESFAALSLDDKEKYLEGQTF